MKDAQGFCDCIENFCTDVLNNKPNCKLRLAKLSASAPPKFVEAGGIFAEVKASRDAERMRFSERFMREVAAEGVEPVAVGGLVPKFKHVCPEWDFLEIDETFPEFEACLCFKTKAARAPNNGITDLIESLRAEAIQAGGQWGQYYPLTLATPENIMKLLNYIAGLETSGQLRTIPTEKREAE